MRVIEKGGDVECGVFQKFHHNNNLPGEKDRKERITNYVCEDLNFIFLRHKENNSKLKNCKR